MPEYLSNKRLCAEIVACQLTMVVSHRLAEMLILLVDRIAMKPNWRNYSFLSDMKGDALLQLVKCNQSAGLTRGNDYRPNILKFDFGYSERSGKAPNAFAYATQIVTNSFRKMVKLEGALAELRDDCLEQANITPSNRRQVYNEANRSSDPIPIIPRPGPRPRGRPRTKA